MPPSRISWIEAMDDEALMMRYQAGDALAFDALFKRHSGRVLGFLLKRLSSAQLAEELAQEVFLKLHRSRGQYDKSLAFAPWLFTITRNVWIDHLKKRKENPAGAKALEHLVANREPGFEPQAEILAQLLPNQQTAVAMKIYDDATFEEIAAKLATSAANARQLFSRGMRRLKETMKLKKEEPHE